MPNDGDNNEASVPKAAANSSKMQNCCDSSAKLAKMERALAMANEENQQLKEQKKKSVALLQQLNVLLEKNPGQQCQCQPHQMKSVSTQTEEQSLEKLVRENVRKRQQLDSALDFLGKAAKAARQQGQQQQHDGGGDDVHCVFDGQGSNRQIDVSSPSLSEGNQSPTPAKMQDKCFGDLQLDEEHRESAANVVGSFMTHVLSRNKVVEQRAQLPQLVTSFMISSSSVPAQLVMSAEKKDALQAQLMHIAEIWWEMKMNNRSSSK